MTSLPPSSVRADFAAARRVLDERHHGLEDAKDRILDHVAVLLRVGRAAGPVPCLVGPPGVGKTALGRSVAHALGRAFVRVPLGDAPERAEIRVATHPDADTVPPWIARAIRRAATPDPVVLLDELDRIGDGGRGETTAALLDIFKMRYDGQPGAAAARDAAPWMTAGDLRRVVFFATATTPAGIPAALRERLELIRIPGYLDDEKVAIARSHLWPRWLAAHGLSAGLVSLDPGVLPAIVDGYTSDAGVRELDRQLAWLAAKLTRRLLEADAAGDPAGAVRVRVRSLPSLLGPAPNSARRGSRADRVGVARAAAYTPSGAAAVMEVEATVLSGSGRLLLTGALGEVMRESAVTALSCLRGRATALGIPDDFHRMRDIHVHIPDCATPKDGPSGGIAIAAAVASALTDRPVRGDVAATGEITPRGRVLAVGGIREKMAAAQRSRIRAVVFPRSNEKELQALPHHMWRAVRVRMVASVDEALTFLLRGPAAESTDSHW